jgi:hypothetical protein
MTKHDYKSKLGGREYKVFPEIFYSLSFHNNKIFPKFLFLQRYLLYIQYSGSHKVVLERHVSWEPCIFSSNYKWLAYVFLSCKQITTFSSFLYQVIVLLFIQPPQKEILLSFTGQVIYPGPSLGQIALGYGEGTIMKNQGLCLGGRYRRRQTVTELLRQR